MRMVTVALLFLIAVVALPAQYVEDMNGTDWRAWQYEQKVGFVQGFYVAYSSIWERMHEELGREPTAAEQQHFRDYFHIEIGTADMVTGVDQFYASPKNRVYTLYSVVMMLAEKDYWNQ